MNDYISKPFQAEDLYAKIIKHLAASNCKEVKLNQPRIDLTRMYELENGDGKFLNDLVHVYNKQTPAFVEKLKGYTKSHNLEAIRAICYQIRSSYGMLKLTELDIVLHEIGIILDSDNADSQFLRITDLVNTITLLISAINEEVKRTLRKTG
jgi:hypothetical protein